jgi:hypothetical protein
MAGTGKWIVGGILSLLGLIGLFLAANAKDDGIYLFGLALAAFAVLYVFGAIKKGFDSIEPSADSAEHPRKTA